MTDINNFSNIISLAQTLINADKDNGITVSPTLISEKIDIAKKLIPSLRIEDSDYQAVVYELIRRFSRWIGQDSTLQDNKNHEAWLNHDRKRNWRYWHRYESYLEKRLSTTVVEGLDKSTDKILELLEDPNRAGSWDRRGLVVGHVQSGKTGNYSGLICKAADAGYKIIIVLAGLHNNLRSQTQVRLEESFLGYETPLEGDYVIPIGVGEIDSDAKIQPNCATNRSNKGDFNTRVASHYAISPEERPWLFVVKKNKTVLDRLLKWIRGHVADSTDSNTGRRYVSNLPLLLIDDEADHASVDTGEQLFNLDGTPDDEHQPKAINSRIRKLLHSFAKSAYVGYTATPFANIFIHRRNATAEEGPDLFPQSFIINLAAPSNYVGPTKVFGLKSKNGREGGLPLSRVIKDHTDETENFGWMPPKHKKEHLPMYLGVEEVPPSLREAIYCFVLTCATRVLRGDGNQHSSMLIHVTRYNQVQSEVRRQVENVVFNIRSRITRAIDHENILMDLKNLWISDFEPTSHAVKDLLAETELPPALPSWDNLLNVLPSVISDIQVKVINGSAKDALDYAENNDKGLKIIAIGGDKLARGLTLEGLSISYFVRTTKMYDTLMQMGRWFGYRPNYIDLCRLYTSKDLIGWFGHIADASEELREEFDTMVGIGATPKEYGLKVQSHSVLMVTSPLKMRSAETLYLSYSGSLVQTVAMHKDPRILGENLDTTKSLLVTIGSSFEAPVIRERDDKNDEWKRSYLWNGVSSDHVIDFLNSFKTHPKASRANSLILSEFIKKMNKTGELTEWTVCLLAEGRDREVSYQFTKEINISSMPSRGDTGIDGSYSIGVLTDPMDESIDLSYPEWKKALEWTLADWKPDPARNRVDPPTKPSGKKIRELKGLGKDDIEAKPEKGLLLLYPLAPDYVVGNTSKSICEDWNEPIMAFAISFPSSDSEVKVEYKVDHKLWEDEYGSAD